MLEDNGSMKSVKKILDDDKLIILFIYNSQSDKFNEIIYQR